MKQVLAFVLASTLAAVAAPKKDQLIVFYKSDLSPAARAVVLGKANAKLRMRYDRTPNYSDEVTVPHAQLQASLKSLKHSHVLYVERVTSPSEDEPVVKTSVPRKVWEHIRYFHVPDFGDESTAGGPR